MITYFKEDFQSSFLRLKHFCESQNFAGYDPYDGLNSLIFKATPLKKWELARLAWIQAFKRLPINFRKLLLVPKGHNAKGIGLFLSAYCNLYRNELKKGTAIFGSEAELLSRINELALLLLKLRIPGYSGCCWGYNFDWQARGGLFFPTGTPTVVATTYAAYGLLDAYELTGNQDYLAHAISAAKFVKNDLNRSYFSDGSFLFSYAPIQGNNMVFNASLLGSKLLARIYFYTMDMELLGLAAQSIKACMQAQETDGSWVYGVMSIQQWKDSYHTGFNLESIAEFIKYTGLGDYTKELQKGTEFYLKNFFLEDGTPKYYHNTIYPIDIHSPAQLLVTLSRLQIFQEHRELATKVLNWTIKNMQHPSKGYFYYQLKKTISSEIAYMRWSQAWMMYAFSFLIIEENEL